jgi:spore coat polysaccharide biosynthesis protein SpsF
MKVVACIIARTVSKRLPLKVLRDLIKGVSMIDFLVQRIKKVSEIDEIYICTSINIVDDILEDVAIRNDIKIYRGSEDEVIERMISVGDLEQADVLLRITGDNPLTSIEYFPNQIKLLIENDLDYVRIVDVPIGASAEVISLIALKDCYSKMDPSVSEYLMLFLFDPDKYKCGVIKVFNDDYSNYSVTVDSPDDLQRTRSLLRLLNGKELLLKDIVKIYKNDSNNFLPVKTFSSTVEVKLPYDKKVLFEEFKKDMLRRANDSKKINLYD